MRLLYPAVALCAAFFAACGSAPEPPPQIPDHFLIMSYNLGGMGELDRNGDGLAQEHKPPEEVEAILSMILRGHPDVLCLQGIGTPDDVELLQDRLAAEGLTFEFSEFLHTPDSPMNLAMLSRFPLIEVVHHTRDVYSMGAATVPVTHGYLEATVSVNPDYRFTLFNADLKNKDYHALGQTEMRRNEARLLNNHIREALKKSSQPNVIAVGTFHDRIQSAALRAVTGQKQEYVMDTHLADLSGDIWTLYDSGDEVYRRSDYVLVSPSMMAELVPGHSSILQNDQAQPASVHRPLIAAFLSRNIAHGPPGLYHP